MMGYISINQVEQNNILGRNIYSNDGRVLLSKGSTLTIGLISRLKSLGVQSVFIIDNENTKEEEKSEVRAISEETKTKVLEHLSESFCMVQDGGGLRTEELSGLATHIIGEIIENKDVMLELEKMNTYNDLLLIHSLNVAIMSILVGVKFNFSKKALKELGIGALLHDIGKAQEKGNEDQHHARLGFQLLLQKPDISTASAHIAFGHHEFINKKGKPRGIGGNDIHPYAKIVAVVNAYDNLVHPQDGAEPLLPCEAGEHIMALAGTQFDYRVVWQFLRSIAFYPTGSNVVLSNGNIGTIVAQNKGLPQRPVVRVFSDNTKHKFLHYNIEEINLAKTPTIFIHSTLAE